MVQVRYEGDEENAQVSPHYKYVSDQANCNLELTLHSLESTQTTWVPPQGGTPQGTGGVVPDTMHGSKAIISRPGIPHSTLRGVLRIFGARGIYFLWSLFFPSPDDSHHKSKSQYYLVYAQSSWLFQKSYA